MLLKWGEKASNGNNHFIPRKRHSIIFIFTSGKVQVTCVRGERWWGTLSKVPACALTCASRGRMRKKPVFTKYCAMQYLAADTGFFYTFGVRMCAIYIIKSSDAGVKASCQRETHSLAVLSLTGVGPCVLAVSLSLSFSSALFIRRIFPRGWDKGTHIPYRGLLTSKTLSVEYQVYLSLSPSLFQSWLCSVEGHCFFFSFLFFFFLRQKNCPFSSFIH